MAGKALESFLATLYPLLTYPWDRGAKSSTASEQVASWLSGDTHVEPSTIGPCTMRTLQGSSAELCLARSALARSVHRWRGLLALVLAAPLP
jgi:hypothetical protein